MFEVGECSKEESGSRGAVGGRACCCETVPLPHDYNETNKETSDKPLCKKKQRRNEQKLTRNHFFTFKKE